MRKLSLSTLASNDVFDIEFAFDNQCMVKLLDRRGDAIVGL